MKIEGIRKNSKIWKNLFCRINFVSYVRYIIYTIERDIFFFALLCLPRCYY